MTDVWAAFVAARLDEEQAAARAATPGPWVHSGTQDAFVDAASGHLISEMDRCDEHPDRRHADAEHIARHDPARVLRWVAALQEIVAALAPPDEATAEAWSNEEHVAHEVYGALVLKRLAFIWGDHPDHPGRAHQIPHSVV